MLDDLHFIGTSIALALLCFEQLVLVLISLIRFCQSRKTILDLDLWFQTLQSAAMFSLFCFPIALMLKGKRYSLRSASARSPNLQRSFHRAMPLKWSNASAADGDGLSAGFQIPRCACDVRTFYRQLLCFGFGIFTVDWAIRI